MRIIAGSLGGRVILSPGVNSVHPMSEKVRGAIFSSLGDINGLSILDAYSGSGAMAIEAVSRGARNVVAVELNKVAARTIRQNISSLELTEYIKLYEMSIESWLKINESKYDVVIADPPYDKIKQQKINQIITDTLAPQGLFVLSWPIDLPAINGYAMIKSVHYGDANVGYYRQA
jgi:16S rRNA (guanine966-N2)-methyltransferase